MRMQKGAVELELTEVMSYTNASSGYLALRLFCGLPKYTIYLETGDPRIIAEIKRAAEEALPEALMQRTKSKKMTKSRRRT